MRKSQIAPIVLLTLVTLALGACSRVKEDWKAAQAADTTEAYQDFLKQHPDSEFGVAAQERVRQLAEDRDWQAAAKADTLDAYQQFVAAHADGKWAQEARVRIENFQLSGGGQAPAAAVGADGSAPGTAPAVASTGGTGAASTAAVAGAAAAAAKPAATASTAKAATASSTHSASATHPATHASSASTKSTGKHYAQLGAYSSKSGAEAAWHQISGKFPTQLKSLQPHYSSTSGTKPLVRLQVALPTSERVHELCSELKRQSQACIPQS
jgi:cell division protein FtsN